MFTLKGVLVRLLFALTLFTTSLARDLRGPAQQWLKPYGDPVIQKNVTWDEHSLLVDGKRILIYSGEFHPFRLPVPTLWLDVLQKIRSLGYTAVSFYVDWALVEGTPGEIRVHGVFALEPFFEAAKRAGIYLIARPGPYINAEVSGGGYPGWLQRINGHLRTTDKDYLRGTDLYIQTICEIIARAQITNGGPVIIVQPENEYTHWAKGFKNDPKYFNYVKEQFKRAGIVVPLITNDAGPDGNNVPGSSSFFDIYGHDGYPLGFDCSRPDVWSPGRLPTDWWEVHQKQSPSTPYTIPEFQGGSFDPWGGPGFEKCASLTNTEFERVFWKNLYSFGVTIYNVYMIYGGTNWGNMGHPGGYTSYDYGAAITEDRLVSREKYSEAKLQANFLLASPAYLTAIPHAPQAGGFVTTADLTVTQLRSNKSQFLVVRHTDYASKASTPYHLLLSNTSVGNLTVPHPEGHLTLHGRDSKVIVVDYDLYGTNLVYSTPEIFTVKQYGEEVVLVVYSDTHEQHEMAISQPAAELQAHSTSSNNVRVLRKKNHTVLSWNTTSDDSFVKLGLLTVWILDRNSAYTWWVLDVAEPGHGNTPYSGQAEKSVIIKGGYLMRTASIKEDTLFISGDINATTPIEIIAGAPNPLYGLFFNDEYIPFKQDAKGVVTAELLYKPVDVSVPNLVEQTWYYANSLPEIQGAYSDAEWITADIKATNNSFRDITTPTSLYSSDYGFHAGTLLYRGQFQANGNEKTFFVRVQGGTGFGFSAWLDDHFLGSFDGRRWTDDGAETFDLPVLKANETHILTLVVDTMGYDENWVVGQDDMKGPRGILDYELDGHPSEEVTWKITGNLGGEHYLDKSRGPLNEGGMWAERQGFHLPNSPVTDAKWKVVAGGPKKGISEAGIAWYVTSFDLDMPKGYDVPLAIQLPAISSSSTLVDSQKTPSAYRVQIYVNGWQFGKYVHHIGPQTKFPVPEGIWDYRGKNWISISLWAMDASGASIDDIKLVTGPVIQTGYTGVKTVDAPDWSARPGVY